jgi:hypothetical protein
MIVDNFGRLSLTCAKDSSAIANGRVRIHQVSSAVDCAANWWCRKHQAGHNNKAHGPLNNTKPHWIIQGVPRLFLNYIMCIKITTADLIDDTSVGWTLLLTQTYCSHQPCQMCTKFRRFGNPLYPHHVDKLSNGVPKISSLNHLWRNRLKEKISIYAFSEEVSNFTVLISVLYVANCEELNNNQLIQCAEKMRNVYIRKMHCNATSQTRSQQT